MLRSRACFQVFLSLGKYWQFLFFCLSLRFLPCFGVYCVAFYVVCLCCFLFSLKSPFWEFICGNSIAKLFRVSCGVSHSYRAICCKMEYCTDAPVEPSTKEGQPPSKRIARSATLTPSQQTKHQAHLYWTWISYKAFL